MYEKYQNDIHFITINTRDKVNKGKLLIEELGYTFPVIYDDGSITELFRVTPIPMNFFIDKEGVIQIKKLGTIDEMTIENYLQYLLEE